MRKLSAGSFESFERDLAAPAKVRLTNFLRDERRRQFVVGRTLLRLGACRLTRKRWHEITIDEGPVKPEVRSTDGDAFASSISHSAHWVGVALSKRVKVGIDLELINPSRNIVEIAYASCERDELQYVLWHQGVEQVNAFYRLWCMKEALYKLTGKTRLPDTALSSMDSNAMNLMKDSVFQIFEYPELMIAICFEQPVLEINLSIVSDLDRQVGDEKVD